MYLLCKLMEVHIICIGIHLKILTECTTVGTVTGREGKGREGKERKEKTNTTSNALPGKGKGGNTTSNALPVL